MKDRYTLGALSGMVAQIPKFLIGQGLVLANIAHLLDSQVAAGIFLKVGTVLTWPGFLVGTIAAFLISAVLGVVVVYLLTFTGRDYWVLKGASVGALFWVGLWGVLVNLGGSKVHPLLPSDNLINLALYTLWAVLSAYFALRWGDEGLFEGVDKLS